MKQLIFLSQLFFLMSLSQKTLVHNELPENIRLKKLSPYFYPSPNGHIEIADQQVQLFRQGKIKNWEMLKGYIEVKPPKGYCFTITRDSSIPDDVVCQNKVLSFKLGDLDHAGRLQWFIRTGPKDFGSNYYWYAPHRVAQVIPAGEKIPRAVPIRYCIAQRNKQFKRIFLEKFSGGQWVINFPLKDKLMKQPPPMPNLYIHKDEKKGGITADKTVGGSDDRYYEYVHPKADDPVTRYWEIPPRHSYIMSASQVNIGADNPPGALGQCRYKYKGAKGDPQHGWIECHHIDQYDVLFAYLSCSHTLAP